MTGGTAATRVAQGGRAVIVGTSLAGLRAAEALRAEGFAGSLMLIGEEPHEPYDRPPLSKRVLAGRMPAEHATLPRMRNVEAEWLLGVAATGLDAAGHLVLLANGRQVGFDRLLITTGTHARPWPNEEEGALDGVFMLHGRDDAARLRTRLASGPRRVLVIGGGFTGSEVASVCRELGLAVTLTERSAAPLGNALGAAAGAVAARLQRQHGVDLRCNTTVMALEGDDGGRLRRARLSDGDVLDVDVARWPHPLYDGQLLSVEHWCNAVEQATTAAHNMVCVPSERRAHKPLPAFWSNQFGVNIKSVGLPTVADEVVVTQGSVEEYRFVAAYGQAGRTVAAVAVNSPRWLESYQRMIEEGAPFPPNLNAADEPTELRPVPVGFLPPGYATHSPGAAATGPGPNSPEPPVGEEADARVPPGPPPL